MAQTQPETKSRRGIFIWIFAAALTVSSMSPHDRLTWWLEVTPGILIALALIASRRSFVFSDLVYLVLLIHGLVLVIGGHYTYAEVPYSSWLSFGGSRNNFDKIGHFFQGFTPVLAGAEFFLRRQIVKDRPWLFLLLFLGAAGISAIYEIIEWLAAELLGSSAESFLGTQGYQWDTQSDMLMACIGAATALAISAVRRPVRI